MSSRYAGSCLCGAVRFEVFGTFQSFFLCHCDRCRKDTGSAHGANLFSTTARLEWIAGEANATTFRVPDTRHEKSFCRTCGSALPGLQLGGALLVVPAGSLDSPVDIRPTGHIFFAHRADWDQQLEEAPKFDRLPG